MSKDESGIGAFGGSAPYVRTSEADAYKREAEAARAQATQAVKDAAAKAQQQIVRYREQYPAKLRFDYRYKAKADRPPFSITAIYHDDKFTYIKSNAQEKPTIYEVKGGKPNLVNFDFQNGVYIIPKIVDKGCLAIGKRKLSFERRS